MSTPDTTSALTDAYYADLADLTGANSTLTLADLKAMDVNSIINAQADFLTYAYSLDNSVPIAEAIRPTSDTSDSTLPIDFSVALQAGSLPSWALSVPLLLTTVKDEFGPSLGS